MFYFMLLNCIVDNKLTWKMNFGEEKKSGLGGTILN